MVGNSITFENKKKRYERNESNKAHQSGVLAARAENLAQDRTVFRLSVLKPNPKYLLYQS